MMESPLVNGGGHHNLNTLQDRMAFYKHVDQTRQNEFDDLAHQLLEVQAALETARCDLEDERATRRNYRRRAEEAESARVSVVFAREYCSQCAINVRVRQGRELRGGGLTMQWLF
jgi:hypothetical protein